MPEKSKRPALLNSLTPLERSELAGLTLSYINDEIVAAHSEIVHFGEATFIGHGEYVNRLEDFLAGNGGRRFVPLPAWDPAEPIPKEFDVVKERDDGTPRPPLKNLNPGMPLPAKFVMPELCDFGSAGSLGNEINPWHVHVHTTVGGTLGQFRIASAAPIFWNFHVFVGQVYRDWQRFCSGQAPAGT